MITQVQVTEGGVSTNYAALCPSGQDRTQWLEKLVHGVILAPKNMRKFTVPETALVIDRINVTSVTTTQDAN